MYIHVCYRLFTVYLCGCMCWCVWPCSWDTYICFILREWLCALASWYVRRWVYACEWARSVWVLVWIWVCVYTYIHICMLAWLWEMQLWDICACFHAIMPVSVHACKHVHISMRKSALPLLADIQLLLLLTIKFSMHAYTQAVCLQHAYIHKHTRIYNTVSDSFEGCRQSFWSPAELFQDCFNVFACRQRVKDFILFICHTCASHTCKFTLSHFDKQLIWSGFPSIMARAVLLMCLWMDYVTHCRHNTFTSMLPYTPTYTKAQMQTYIHTHIHISHTGLRLRKHIFAHTLYTSSQIYILTLIYPYIPTQHKHRASKPGSPQTRNSWYQAYSSTNSITTGPTVR